MSSSGFQSEFIEIVERQLKLCQQEVCDYDQQIEEKVKEIDGLRADREAAATRAQQLSELLGRGELQYPEADSGLKPVSPIADADSVVELIRERGQPMHYIDIHQALVDRGFEIGGEGKPDTLLSRYFKDPRLTRVSRGTYDLAKDEGSQTTTDGKHVQRYSRLQLPRLPSPPIRGLNPRMTLSEMIEKTLEQQGNPLHYREITERIKNSGVWHSRGKTPEATINSVMVVDIKDNGDQSVFIREGRGVYGLRKWKEDAP
jgi:hypothetical protein